MSFRVEEAKNVFAGGVVIFEFWRTVPKKG
jgi:hypothetical protein